MLQFSTKPSKTINDNNGLFSKSLLCFLLHEPPIIHKVVQGKKPSISIEEYNKIIRLTKYMQLGPSKYEIMLPK